MVFWNRGGKHTNKVVEHKRSGNDNAGRNSGYSVGDADIIASHYGTKRKSRRKIVRSLDAPRIFGPAAPPATMTKLSRISNLRPKEAIELVSSKPITAKKRKEHDDDSVSVRGRDRERSRAAYTNRKPDPILSKNIVTARILSPKQKSEPSKLFLNSGSDANDKKDENSVFSENVRKKYSLSRASRTKQNSDPYSKSISTTSRAKSMCSDIQQLSSFDQEESAALTKKAFLENIKRIKEEKGLEDGGRKSILKASNTRQVISSDDMSSPVVSTQSKTEGLKRIKTLKRPNERKQKGVTGTRSIQRTNDSDSRDDLHASPRHNEHTSSRRKDRGIFQFDEDDDDIAIVYSPSARRAVQRDSERTESRQASDTSSEPSQTTSSFIQSTLWGSLFAY